MDLLGIGPGKTVADIGAGSGWFTVQAAKRVSASGIVYAWTSTLKAIHYIENRLQKEQLHNVKTILAVRMIRCCLQSRSILCYC